VETRQVLWRRGPWAGRRDGAAILRSPVFYRGAPAAYGERLYVYGAVRERADDGPTRKESAYLFCFARRDGRLLWHRLLGYAETDAPPTLPPVSGLPPAVSQGVVVAVTGVGVAAALDADSGEILWLLRYDRKPLPERGRLRVVREKWVTLRPGWKRQPPAVVGDYVHFAPHDSDALHRCWLRGRRRPEDGAATLVCWTQRRDRDLGRNVLLEYVAGFHGGRGYYVGVRDPDRERWGPPGGGAVAAVRPARRRGRHAARPHALRALRVRPGRRRRPRDPADRPPRRPGAAPRGARGAPARVRQPARGGRLAVRGDEGSRAGVRAEAVNGRSGGAGAGGLDVGRRTRTWDARGVREPDGAGRPAPRRTSNPPGNRPNSAIRPIPATAPGRASVFPPNRILALSP